MERCASGVSLKSLCFFSYTEITSCQSYTSEYIKIFESGGGNGCLLKTSHCEKFTLYICANLILKCVLSVPACISFFCTWVSACSQCDLGPQTTSVPRPWIQIWLYHYIPGFLAAVYIWKRKKYVYGHCKVGKRITAKSMKISRENIY